MVALVWRDCASWHFREQIKHVLMPFLAEHRLLLVLPVHDVRSPSSDGHDLGPVTPDVLSSWSFESFSILGLL